MFSKDSTPFPLPPSRGGGFRPPHILTSTFLGTVLIAAMLAVSCCGSRALTSPHQMAQLVVLMCVSLRTDVVEHLPMGRLGWPFDGQLWINVCPEHLPILIGVSENGVFLVRVVRMHIFKLQRET